MAGTDIPVLLLCAGFGTRMGSLTSTTPKPLLEVAGRPMLDRLLEEVAGLDGLGVVHLVTNSRYRTAFEGWAAGWRRRLPRGIEVHDDGVASPAARLGAVGDLAWLLERTGVPGLGALVAAGDNLFRFSLAPFWRALLGSRSSLILAVREEDRERLRATGVLELAEDDRVLALVETPREPSSRWAAPALYGLRPRSLARVWEYLAAGGSPDSLGSFVAWLAEREPVRAFRAAGSRLHVGTGEDLRRAQRLLAREGD